MIVSINEWESQIWPCCEVRVRLNGENLRYCTYADDVLGYVIVHDMDSKRDSICGDFQKKILLGSVEILIGDDFK